MNFEEVHEYYDGICNGLGQGRYMCNIVTTNPVAGSAAFTGVLEFDPGEFGIGTGSFIMTGGADMNAGLAAKITSEFTEDLVTHSVCFQVPPANLTE